METPVMSRGINMIVSKIVTAIISNVNSSDYTQAIVLEVVNRGLIEIAGGGNRQHGNAEIAPLPNLLTYDDVSLLADDFSVALPANYQRGVIRVECNGGRLKQYENFNKFIDMSANTSGDVAGYCVKGHTLWVGPTQTTDTTLKVYYHKVPDTLSIVAYSAGPPVVTAVDSVPDCLPEHLQFPLLYHYASKEIFSTIEQGIEGAVPDTLKHDSLYQKALTDLERFIGPADGDAINVSDDLISDDYII